MMKPYWPNSDTHSKYNELAACTTTYRGDGYSFLLPSAEVLHGVGDAHPGRVRWLANTAHGLDSLEQVFEDI